MVVFEPLPVSLRLSNLKLVDYEKSRYHGRIELFEHKDLGKVLLIGGEIHHIEVWTPLYHETVVHLPIAFINDVKRVLILGGGDFFIAEEVLKYDSIKEIVMIEHDAKVVKLISRNYQHVNRIIKDRRFKLQINDAFVGLNKLKKKFDLIINDSVDLINYPKLKKGNIFSILSSHTNYEGVCCDLIYRHIFEKRTTEKTLKLLGEIGLNTAYSLVSIPEYPGVLHLLTIWGNNRTINQNITRPLNKIQKGWIRKPKSNPCVYYNPSCLNYYLYLAPYLKRITNGSHNI